MADNLVQKVTAGTGELLSFLTEIQNNLDEARAFINLMGWELPAGLDDIGLATIDLGDFVQKLDAVTGAPNEVLEDEIEMLGRIAELTQAVNNLVQTIHTLATELPAKLSGFGDYIDRTNIHKELPRRLFDFLLTNYLARTSPLSYAVLHLVNIIDYPHFNADPVNFQVEHVRATINYHHFKTLFTDPGKLAEEAYGWNRPEYDSTILLQRIHLLLQAVGLRSRMQPLDRQAEEIWTNNAVSETLPMPQLITFLYEERGAIAGIRVGLSIFGARPTGPGASDGGLGMVPIVRGKVQGSIPLFRFSDTFLDFSSDADLLKGVGFIVRPNQDLEVKTASSFTESIAGRFALGFRHGSPESELKTLASFPGDVKIQFQTFTLTGGLEKTSEKPTQSFLELALLGCKVTLSTSEADGFLRNTISQKKIEAPFDIKIGWTSSRGIYFEGSGGLEVSLPAYIQVGPFRLEALHLGLKTGEQDLALEVSATGSLNLGPVKAVVDRMGLKVDLSFGSGNLGFFGLSPGFKPPSGIGLSIDSGVIKGGGFLYFDSDKGEYFGALELEFSGMFSMKAIGIINTKMPDGSDGFSLLVIITAEFTPMQLGFGFTLNGVGGLLGLNRTTRIEVLKEGIKTNAIKSILFPEDVVANISRIISDIRQVFPPQKDHFLIAPMAKIGWGTPSIVTLELGLLIEIPIKRIVLLGVLRAMLPQENSPLLKLQVNFLGVIDFENRYISFDASLYDSRLLIYTLTGQMALRISWGDKPVFILSAGGFHPAFKEAPSDLHRMERMTISLLSGENPRITIQSYFAITSNTAQFGAKAELYAAKGGFNIYGFIGYDVLFQFEPFHFIADFSAGLALRRGTSVVMGIHVSGQLSGPTPWDAKGEASISFFFFSISVSFHETWGERPGTIEPSTADLIQLLTAEINDDRNWRSDVPPNNSLHVSIKKIPETEGTTIIHPFGILTFSERLVPLEVDLQKFGNKVPKDASRFEIRTTETSLTTEPVREQFALANFIEMSDSEKLSRSSFEAMTSGFKITGSGALQTPAAVNKNVDYELSYLGKKRSRLFYSGSYKYGKAFFRTNTKGGAVSRSALSYANKRIPVNAPDDIVISEQQFVIANTDNMKLHSEELVAGSYTEAVQFYNQLVTKQPALKDQVQIVSEYELN